MDAYIYRAALYCEDCAQSIRRALATSTNDKSFINDSETWPQGPYPNGGGESDTPAHCDSCMVFLENELTTEGERYTADALIDNDGDAATLARWRAFYPEVARYAVEQRMIDAEDAAR